MHAGIHVAQSVISGVADPFPATRAMWAVAWVLGVAYFSHLYYAQQQRAFWSWPWISVTIVNALSILLVLAASLSLFVLSFDDEFMARFEATSGSTDVIGVRVAAIAGASYFLVSFLLSALRSFSAMSQMSSSVLPYILFLPTINAYFFAYSLCRYDCKTKTLDARQRALATEEIDEIQAIEEIGQVGQRNSRNTQSLLVSSLFFFVRQAR